MGNKQPEPQVQKDQLNKSVTVAKPPAQPNNPPPVANPIKKEDPELDPLERQVKEVFDELIQSIDELDKDIEAMVKEIRDQQS